MNTTRNDIPDWKAPTPKELQLNRVLLKRTDGKVHQLLERLLKDEEVNLYHSYANVVSVRRLGYNDHGPVHARITTYNALKILRLLNEGGVQTSLENEHVSTFEASQVAVALGCFLHDTGMGVARDKHEWHSVNLIDPIIVRYLEWLYPDNMALRVVIRSMAHEIIVGHMAHTRIHSIEAGVVLVADGTDMTKGRSLIPINLQLDPEVGDMHRYSANTISKVEIEKESSNPLGFPFKWTTPPAFFKLKRY